jgi:two-component system, OmpR family, copper resistance phosphate regulon response regulator CusR
VARILIAEDHAAVGSSIEKALTAAGFATMWVQRGDTALSLALTEEFDLVVLDMGLPERDGFHVLQQLRWRGNTVPVLVLTGRTERDVVAALDAGADDYMRKPFEYRELIARIGARLRQPRKAPEYNLLRGGGVTLDVRTRRVAVGDRSVELSTREFGMLEALLRHAGQILSRNQLAALAWGPETDPNSNVVEVAVSQLRKKLGDGIVETIRGAGYRLGRAS